MTNQTMFNEAHAQARIEAKRFGITYRRAFGNALRGFYAVRRGFNGVEIIDGKVWG